MDERLVFSRTEKGRTELLGAEHQLKQRQRQVLFLINDAISVHALRERLPGCQELDGILEMLWELGFIGQVKGGQDAPSGIDLGNALNLLCKSRLDAARQHALSVISTLMGDRSPAYGKVQGAKDLEAFTQAVASARRMMAAASSSSQAEQFETGVLAILRLPDNARAPASAPSKPDLHRMNGIEAARMRALDIVRSAVGERSPIYVRLTNAHNRAEFLDAVGAGKKVLAAVASSSRAAMFESEVLGLLQDH